MMQTVFTQADMLAETEATKAVVQQQALALPALLCAATSERLPL